MNKVYYSLLGPYINQFFDFKKSLGFKYQDSGSVFSQLDNFAIKKDLSEIILTKEFADEFCLKRINESVKTRYNRVQVYSQFVHFLNDLGLKSYVPNLPKLSDSFTPYIFSTEQMNVLFTISDQLKPCCHSRNSAKYTIPFLIRLLYGTGLRIGEALYLLRSDVNLDENYLLLRNTKNGKDRMVPMSDSLTAVCRGYLAYLALVPGTKKSDRLFIRPDGNPLTSFTAYKWFRRILWTAKISHGGRGGGPRLHDMRHTFSVHSLAIMARDGLDLYHSLPLLSVYLGHQSLEATEGYVRLTAEMYPDLLKKSATISSNVFPIIERKGGENEAN